MLLSALHVLGVFAVVAPAKLWGYEFITPDLATRSLGVLAKMLVSFGKVPVNRGLCFVHGLIIAVMDHSLGHSTEHGLDNIQELSTGWQGS